MRCYLSARRSAHCLPLCNCSKSDLNFISSMSKYRIFLAGATLFTTLICWSLSYPVNSHRDERFHIASIWCATYDIEHCRLLGEDKHTGKVYLISSDLCVPKNIEETYKRLLVKARNGVCKREKSDNDNLTDSNVTSDPNFFYETPNSFASTISVNRSQHFYKVMSFFISENMGRSILMMRMFNSLLFSLLVMGILSISSKKLLISFFTSLLLSAIAYGFPLITSVNTSSWAVIGCTTGWPFLYTLLKTRPVSLLKKLLLISLTIATALLSIVGRSETLIFVFAIYLSVWVVVIYQHDKPTHTNLWKKSLISLMLIFFLTRLYEKSQGFELDLVISVFQKWRYQIPILFEPRNFFLDIGASIKRSLLLLPRILGLENPHWQPPGAPKVIFWISAGMLLILLKVFISQSNKIQINFLLSFVIFIFSIVTVHTFFSPQAVNFYYFRTDIFGDELHSRYLMPLVPFTLGFAVFLSKDSRIQYDKLKLRSSLITVSTFVNSICLIAGGQIFREHQSWFWVETPFAIQAVGICGSISFYIFAVVAFSTELINSLDFPDAS